MATDPGTIDLLLDRLGDRGAHFTTKRMFGEYCLYRDGLPVALVCDDVLFVKDTVPGRAAVAALGDVALAPPYPGARPHLGVPPDLWDDGDALRRLLDVTASALPAPKAKSSGPAGKTSRAARTKPAATASDAATRVPRRTKAAPKADATTRADKQSSAAPPPPKARTKTSDRRSPPSVERTRRPRAR